MSDSEKSIVYESDEAVIGTNDEATQCKRSAVHKGYWQDPFIRDFCKHQHSTTSIKSPEINMGYYIRVYAMRSLIDHFLTLYGDKAQIVNIGCGFDTTYWMLMRQGKKFRKFVEIDLPVVVYRKAHTISHKPNLMQYFKDVIELPPEHLVKSHSLPSPLATPTNNNESSLYTFSNNSNIETQNRMSNASSQSSINNTFALNTPQDITCEPNNTLNTQTQHLQIPRHHQHHRGSVTPQDHEIHSLNYNLFSGDLRNLSGLNAKFDRLAQMLPASHCLDVALPTLFIAECVLVYMEMKETDSLLHWITNKFKGPLCLLSYEQINMGDHFGEIMQQNLRERGCSLLGVDECLNEHSQKHRYIDSGWDSAQVESMLKIFHAMPQLEKHRILTDIEFLDEKELLYQLLDHYCLCWACKNIDYNTEVGRQTNMPMLNIVQKGTII